MKSPVLNFAAGPAMLPNAVLEQARNELLDWRGSGMSVMEMSHRGKDYMSIQANAEADLRELMDIPVNYKVLFLQGGASTQFAMIPMNLLRGKASADYLNTGVWSLRAIKEARMYAGVNVVASSEDKGFTYVPTQTTWKLDPNAAYVHCTMNETISGVELFWTPETGDVPLVADMSSNILSRPIDVSKFGLIYAGAQKNIGMAGLTIVIVREDLLGHACPGTPTMFDYKLLADNDSMFNTPPTYAIYIAGLVFKWLKAQGGVAEIEQVNIAKAQLLYDALDSSDLFVSHAAKANRSRMNISFMLKDAALCGEFIEGAEARGMVQLKGHSSVGGMRASIYNAMPIEGIQTLVEYLNEFEGKHG